MSKPTDIQRADAFALQEALDYLWPRDREFAGSLLAQYHERGNLSPKQWDWVHKLADKAVLRAPYAIAEHITSHILSGNY